MIKNYRNRRLNESIDIDSIYNYLDKIEEKYLTLSATYEEYLEFDSKFRRNMQEQLSDLRSSIGMLKFRLQDFLDNE